MNSQEILSEKMRALELIIGCLVEENTIVVCEEIGVTYDEARRFLNQKDELKLRLRAFMTGIRLNELSLTEDGSDLVPADKERLSLEVGRLIKEALLLVRT